MMHKVPLDIKILMPFGKFETVSHSGYSTDTPGLAVCRKLQCVSVNDGYIPTSRWWQVIHIASGFPIGPEGIYLTTRRDALAVAQDLGPLADWTTESSKLTRNLALRDQAYAVFEQYK